MGSRTERRVAPRLTTQPWQKMSAHMRMFLQATVAALIPAGASAGDAVYGEYLSSECVTCHQLSGRSTGGIPPIVGLAETHFIDAMQAYKSGERDNEVMRNIAARLTAEDMAALAAYFAQQGAKHQ